VSVLKHFEINTQLFSSFYDRNRQLITKILKHGKNGLLNAICQEKWVKRAIEPHYFNYSYCQSSCSTTEQLQSANRVWGLKHAPAQCHFIHNRMHVHWFSGLSRARGSLMCPKSHGTCVQLSPWLSQFTALSSLVLRCTIDKMTMHCGSLSEIPLVELAVGVKTAGRMIIHRK
jgi:hypothetical protein